ncbi:hypothetical protein [Phenylobacterium sp.]|uniref:hypothetical protein n=1 Tax=Phenylobacterium sp. TaxID=1871053 RepID=UPI00286A1060|nr:hypothetical protein [Phenylobacterium sp.]
MSAYPTAFAAALLLSLCAAPALAEEAISTAGAGQALSATAETAAQIDRWIADAPRPADDERAMPDQPRRIHGEVGVAVGTGGYRSGYLISQMPLGETGSLTLAIGQTRNGRGYYSHDDNGFRRPLSPRPMD